MPIRPELLHVSQADNQQVASPQFGCPGAEASLFGYKLTTSLCRDGELLWRGAVLRSLAFLSLDLRDRSRPGLLS